MTFRSIQCFSNDGRLDAQELKALLEIAERDGVIDDNEARVLRKIIAQVRPEEINAALRDKIAIVEQKIGV
jgi:tellurite resistance protein